MGNKNSKNEKPESSAELMLNVPLAPELKRDLELVANHNSRTQRRQAALYIARCVARDIRRISNEKVNG